MLDYLKKVGKQIADFLKQQSATKQVAMALTGVGILFGIALAYFSPRPHLHPDA